MENWGLVSAQANLNVITIGQHLKFKSSFLITLFLLIRGPAEELGANFFLTIAICWIQRL